ncbi:amino acid adenylation domain-containing protein [Nitrospirillum amazonense]|uniref:Amino acid adenylation domain-containing protein n=1 Tax=Nitrospirillum amazonense TaxID=28077 RepID=A0A560ESQ5_9PROT|nr:non-ribosomal peptide synthetase/type I polyketide synthase [Nitrospirillum amazonense]TWB12409.1 amino acid adenylation domain-containing protein [Nitrospirillum amazonense]
MSAEPLLAAGPPAPPGPSPAWDAEGRRAAELLVRLERMGARLEAREGRLRVDAPAGVLDDATKEAMRAAKTGLIALLQARQSDGIAPIPRGREAVFPLSLPQHAFYMLERLQPGSRAYNVFSLRRLRGAVDPGRLSQALDVVVRRHEPLRTRFILVNGKPQQRVEAPFGAPLAVIDLSVLPDESRKHALARVTDRSRAPRFDLAAGRLFRVELITLDAGEAVLSLAMHHIIADAASLDIFYSELAAAYYAPAHHADNGGAGPNPPAVQYADYAAWQSDRLARGLLDPQIDYWRRRLAALPNLLAAMGANSSGPGLETVRGVLGGGDRRRLADLARQAGTTSFVALLGLFMVLLGRYSRGRDIPVIVPTAGRDRDEVARLIGVFITGLVVRGRVEPGASVAALLSDLSRRVAEALEHSELSIESLEGLLRQRREPLPGLDGLSKIAFNHISTGRAMVAGEAMVEVIESDRQESVFDLMMITIDTPDGLDFKLEIRPGLLGPGGGRRLLDEFLHLVGSALDGGVGAVLDDLAHEVGGLDARRRALLQRCGADSLPLHLLSRPLPCAVSAEGAVAVMRAALARRPDLAAALRPVPAPSACPAVLVEDGSADGEAWAASVVACLSADAWRQTRERWADAPPSPAQGVLRICVVEGSELVVAASEALADAGELAALADGLAAAMGGGHLALPGPTRWRAAAVALAPDPPAAVASPALWCAQGGWVSAGHTLAGELWDRLHAAADQHGITPARLVRGACLLLSATLGDVEEPLALDFLEADGDGRVHAGRLVTTDAWLDPGAAPLAVMVATPEYELPGFTVVPTDIWFTARRAADDSMAPPLDRLVRPGARLRLDFIAGPRHGLLRLTACADAVGGDGGLWLRRLALLLRQLADGPPGFSRLGYLLPDDDGRMAAMAGETCPLPVPPLAAAMVRAVAAARPDRPAVSSLAGETLTYADLMAAVDKVAAALPAPGAAIGVSVARTEFLPAILLGIFSAGCVYVPLDPRLPPRRLADMVSRVDAALVVVDETTQHLFAPLGVPLTTPDKMRAARVSVPAVGDGVNPEATAYVMFTSGSSGRPKGVRLSHRALAAFLDAMLRAPGVYEDDVLLATTTVSFDISLLELLLPLCAGARVVVADEDTPRDGRRLADALRRTGTTLFQATPSAWRMLLDAGWPGDPDLRALSGGEAMPDALARALRSRTREAWNMYGPTETTIWSACGRVEAPDVAAAAGFQDRPQSLGTAIANTRLCIVDRRGCTVPPGGMGELLIGGAGLAIGYLDDGQRTAQAFREVTVMGARAYHTGDRVALGLDGRLYYRGRRDRQVKIRGHRIELPEIEAALLSWPGVGDAVAAVEGEGADARLAAFVTGDVDTVALRRGLKDALPPYMLPHRVDLLPALPRLLNGKIDFAGLMARQGAGEQEMALPAPMAARSAGSGAAGPAAIERDLIDIWRALLGHADFGVGDNFFDVGGHSLLLLQSRDKVNARFDVRIEVIDLFDSPTIRAQSELIAARRRTATPQTVAAEAPPQGETPRRRDVAVVGMAGRFPGAGDLDAFWRNLVAGTESITFLTEDELLRDGADPDLVASDDYVKVAALLDDVELFDAAFFGLSPGEAERMDPQHRLLLECAQAALDDAGYAPRVTGEKVGLFAGTGFSSYFFTNIQHDDATMSSVSPLELLYANDKDYAVAQVAYRLDLRGPCVTVGSACSTGLVAIHQACEALVVGACDLALAGAAKVMTPQRRGYMHLPGGIMSPDGHCRVFDESGGGTVFGSGVGVVVLKPLERALADGDAIHAVIKGGAVNNDGGDKLGLTAPSQLGQARVLRQALAASGVAPESVGYIETHGTGTALGDMVEVAAIRDAYGDGGANGGDAEACILGAVKANIGHLDSAAGLAGFIKAVLCVANGVIPPVPNVRGLNPKLRFGAGRFSVNQTLVPWAPADRPRRAGVSSFGIGGTNAHLLIEQAPYRDGRLDVIGDAAAPPDGRMLFVLSAHSPTALQQARRHLCGHLDRAGGALDLRDVAFTLAVGRSPQSWRWAAVAGNVGELRARLDADDPMPPVAVGQRRTPVVFLLPGQGSQRLGMAAALYRREAAFRAALDECLAHVEAAGGGDLRALLLAMEADPGALTETARAQPALFAMEYALAALWQAWGVVPDAMLGHSLGEWVAAALSGVMPLADAARLIVIRGHAMQACPAGRMVALAAPAEAVAHCLEPEISVAACNAPDVTVIAGPAAAMAATVARLEARGLQARPLHTSHAFHSAAMDAAVPAVRAALAEVAFQAPAIRWISNLTGRWIMDQQATDPDYWCQQLRMPVRFWDGLCCLRETFNDAFMVEVGPGTTLADLVVQNTRARALSSLAGRNGDDYGAMLSAAGALWQAGGALDMQAVTRAAGGRRVHLPPKALERHRHWITPVEGQGPRPRRRGDPADWGKIDTWRRRAALPSPAPEEIAATPWLVLGRGTSALEEAVVAVLHQAGGQVLRMPWGDATGSAPPSATIAPMGPVADDPAAYSQIAALAAGGARCLRIICFWSPREPDGDAVVSDGAAFLDRLMFLIQGLASDDPARRGQVAVVTRGLGAISAGERIDPFAALCLGPVRGGGHEAPNVRLAAVDVGDADVQADQWEQAGALVAELAAGLPDQEVALRGRGRWIRMVEPLALPPPAEPVLQPGGLYAITGGLGDLGFALAKHLAVRWRARLALFSGTPADDPGPAGARVRSRIAELTALMGECPPLYHARVEDAQAMNAAFAELRGTFGPVNGVFHLAGVADGRLLAWRQAGAAAPVLAPKVDGSLVVSGIARAQGIPLLVFFSSLTARLGTVGQLVYASANAFMDALALRNVEDGLRTYAIGWDSWRDMGMAARMGAVEGLAAMARATRRNGIDPAAGLATLEAILGQHEPHVLVSPIDWAARVAAEPALRSGGDAVSAASATEPPRRTPRPRTMPPPVPPETEAEGRLVALWEESFGVAPLGTRDSFFDLGGTSLQAVRMVRSIGALLGQPLSPNVLLRAATIAELVAAASGATPATAQRAASAPTVTLIRDGAAHEPPLVLIHPVGGEVLVYRDLAQTLADRPIHGLSFPKDAPAADLATVERMADAYARAICTALPGLPAVCLGGSSFGGMVALEIARRFQADGGPDVASLLLIDTPGPGEVTAALDRDAEILAYMTSHLPAEARLGLADLQEQPEESLLDYFCDRLRVVAPEAAMGKGQLADLLAVFRHNHRAMLDYRPAPFNGLVHFIRALERRPAYDPVHPERAWASICRDLVIHQAAGNHVTMHAPPHVATLARVVDSILAGTEKSAVA